jgi:hypothetical protein
MMAVEPNDFRTFKNSTDAIKRSFEVATGLRDHARMEEMNSELVVRSEGGGVKAKNCNFHSGSGADSQPVRRGPSISSRRVAMKLAATNPSMMR